LIQKFRPRVNVPDDESFHKTPEPIKAQTAL
jgi:hypothetical protein